MITLLSLYVLPATLLAGLVSVLVYVPAPLKRPAAEVLGVVLVGSVLYLAGYRAAKTACDQAAAAFRAAIVVRDNQITKQASDLSAALQAQADTASRQAAQKERTYEKHLPPAGRCVLSPSDARRLRDIR